MDLKKCYFCKPNSKPMLENLNNTKNSYVKLYILT
jgi:hypothetical protein